MTSIQTRRVQPTHFPSTLGERVYRTEAGCQIGSAHSPKPRADVAGCLSGPHTKPTLADKVIYRFMVPLGALTVVVLLLVERFA